MFQSAHIGAPSSPVTEREYSHFFPFLSVIALPRLGTGLRYLPYIILVNLLKNSAKVYGSSLWMGKLRLRGYNELSQITAGHFRWCLA